MYISENEILIRLAECLILPLDLISFTLMIGWCIYFIVRFHRVYREYKICKQTPVLHPLYSDVLYLSKQRKLYNLKTHITKYVLMIVCCLVEIVGIVGWGLSFISYRKPSQLPNHTTLLFGDLICYPHVWFLIYFGTQMNIFILNFSLCLTSSLPILLAILSRYLAARYLNHPFKRTLIKYLIWCSVQCILIGFCSTPYTWIFLLLLVPIISIVNWIVFLRDTSILSRVVRSNLRDIQLYSNNKVLYNQQLSAFKFYRIFRLVSLVSLFFILLAQIGFFIGGIGRMVFYDTCYIHFDKHISVPMSIHVHTKYNWIIPDFIDYFSITSCILYSFFLCLPLCGLTFIPIIIKCVKRCREKEDQYWYNYNKLEPLLKNYY